MRAYAVLAFALAVPVGCGKPADPVEAVTPAAFDANDAERTFEWSVSLWTRARATAPKGNDAALMSERARSNSEFEGIVGKQVKWPVKARGVASDGLCRIAPLMSDRDGRRYYLVVQARGERTNDDEYLVSLFPFSNRERVKSVGAGSTVTITGTVAEAKLVAGGTLDRREELRAFVVLKPAAVD